MYNYKITYPKCEKVNENKILHLDIDAVEKYTENFNRNYL